MIVYRDSGLGVNFPPVTAPHQHSQPFSLSHFGPRCLMCTSHPYLLSRGEQARLCVPALPITKHPAGNPEDAD